MSSTEQRRSTWGTDSTSLFFLRRNINPTQASTRLLHAHEHLSSSHMLLTAGSLLLLEHARLPFSSISSFLCVCFFSGPSDLGKHAAHTLRLGPRVINSRVWQKWLGRLLAIFDEGRTRLARLHRVLCNAQLRLQLFQFRLCFLVGHSGLLGQLRWTHERSFRMQ